MHATIASLFIYPVKSCRGLALPAAKLTERGFARDREWMIVDSDGRFLSQREEPRLALIQTALLDGALELSEAGASRVAIAFDCAGPSRPVTIWHDTVPAIDQGDAAARWLSGLLGRELRLVRFDPAVHRLCNTVYAGQSGAHTGFADAYPVLVLSEASLADLNARLPSPLPVNRFRPNLLLSGMDAYEEDHLDELRTADIVLKLVKPCTRCQIPTIDQDTGRIGVEPTRTLTAFRMNPGLGGVTFGMNAIVISGAGSSLAAGASLTCALNF